MSKSNGIISIPGGHGQYAPRARFTNEQVESIRARKNNGESCAELARELRVDASTIYRIWRGDTYSGKPTNGLLRLRPNGLGNELARFRRSHKNTPVSQAGAH